MIVSGTMLFQRVSRSVAVAAVIMGSAAHARVPLLDCDTVPADCDKIAIDSSGIFGFHHNAIKWVAVWREIGGIAPWVEIVSPSTGEIVRIIISANLKLRSRPHCFNSVDEPNSVTCVQSIPGVKLQAVVTFSKASHPKVRYEDRMEGILKYILDEVLCCKPPDSSRANAPKHLTASKSAGKCWS
jgi:hypothetical protein